MTCWFAFKRDIQSLLQAYCCWMKMEVTASANGPASPSYDNHGPGSICDFDPGLKRIGESSVERSSAPENQLMTANVDCNVIGY